MMAWVDRREVSSRLLVVWNGEVELDRSPRFLARRTAATSARASAVAGPDPHALDEPENLDQPVDCGADVRIGEFGNHRPGRR